ncbi:conserved hypothetical protein [Theileria equi strain WA]|uniref:C2H2-type domain-containing protein n=1 Tax=Theileria equi strain WA TaxID=1537102 RepID=L1LFL8_THEEQ|nr:conserved hypothetical protein [Theileria equi strain WA]EKX74050.1 conserved hypothetical protein [Theileria equi strain WA]|eukprot:XP_004833502.1 conserved hypothetical protein [Theileria equi strain WA]
MLKLEKEKCSVDSIKLAASIFCRCGVPFSRRFRNVPCYHVNCSSCNEKSRAGDNCTTCKAKIEKVEELHPNEELLVCTVPKCSKGFVNFPSLRVHLKLAHAISANSVEDFYGEFGDLDIKIAETKVIQYTPPSGIDIKSEGNDKHEADHLVGVGDDNNGIASSQRENNDSDCSEDIDILI